MSWWLSPFLSSRVRRVFLVVSLTGPIYSQALSPTPSEWAERIDRAIRTGRDALVPRLDPLVEDPRSDYPIGRISFVLSALLESGLSTRAPTVRRALDKLSRLEPTKTYCVASYLLALGTLLDRLAEDRGAGADGIYEHDSREQDAEAGKLAAAPLTEVTIRTRMADLAEWLVNARTKNRGTWTYEVAGQSRKHDFSNTQFAVFGLHVAMKHGIPIPSEVFAEVIRVFSGSIKLETAPVTLTYRPAMRFEAVLGLEARPRDRRTRVRPGGWAYRATGSSATSKLAYPAMTAAGASSVIVAVKALRRSTGRRWQRVTVQGEKTLHRSYAWIDKHFDNFVADGRKLYYTLYSLEKVGDLGGIASFGQHDWYLEGARRLLDKQRKNGSWGGYVDTAFALLFLTRATRSMDAAAAPMFVTRGGKGGAAQTDEIDLVYVDRAKGFLSARNLLRYMAETRDPRLVDIGKEIVRNYDPRHKENLVPHLLVLWKEPGRLRTFARRALKDITGESFKASRDAHRWYQEFLKIRDLEESSTVTAADVAKKLHAVESLVLGARLVRLSRRRELRDLARELVDEMARTSHLRTTSASSYRRAIHGVLDLWTGGEIPMPADNDLKGWEMTARQWKRWLRRDDR